MKDLLSSLSDIAIVFYFIICVDYSRDHVYFYISKMFHNHCIENLVPIAQKFPRRIEFFKLMLSCCIFGAFYLICDGSRHPNSKLKMNIQV